MPSPLSRRKPKSKPGRPRVALGRAELARMIRAGLSDEEIALRCKCSKNTVRNRKRDARNELGEQWPFVGGEKLDKAAKPDLVDLFPKDADFDELQARARGVLNVACQGMPVPKTALEAARIATNAIRPIEMPTTDTDTHATLLEKIKRATKSAGIVTPDAEDAPGGRKLRVVND